VPVQRAEGGPFAAAPRAPQHAFHCEPPTTGVAFCHLAVNAERAALKRAVISVQVCVCVCEVNIVCEVEAHSSARQARDPQRGRGSRRVTHRVALGRELDNFICPISRIVALSSKALCVDGGHVRKDTVPVN